MSGTIHQPTQIIEDEQLELADSSRIDSFCLIDCTGGVEIESESCIHAGTKVIGSGGLTMAPRSVICYNVVVCTSSADLSYPVSSVVPKDERASIEGEITLGRESAVFSGAVLAPGVTLAEGAVVAANSYVDEDIPPWTVRLPNGDTRERPTDSPDFDR